MYADYPHFRMDELEVRTFLREPNRQFQQILINRALPLLASALVLVGGFYVLNFSAFQRARSTTEQTTAVAPATPTPQTTAQAVTSSTPSPTPAPAAVAAYPDNTIVASTINVSAPIHWDTAFDETVLQEQLKSGVIQLTGTAKPGQKGTVVIFGHSSNYPWVKGDYNTVFASLSQLKKDQDIIIQYNGVTYHYAVTRSYEVQPTDLSVLSSNSDQSLLRVITCTPVGTSLRRLVVEAKQVSPDPATNSEFKAASFAGNIPGDR